MAETRNLEAAELERRVRVLYPSEEAAGELSLPELLCCRVRYFTAGAAIGSKAYVEALTRERKDYLSPGRRTGPSRIRAAALEGCYSLRGLQKDPIG